MCMLSIHFFCRVQSFHNVFYSMVLFLHDMLHHCTVFVINSTSSIVFSLSLNIHAFPHIIYTDRDTERNQERKNQSVERGDNWYKPIVESHTHTHTHTLLSQQAHLPTIHASTFHTTTNLFVACESDGTQQSSPNQYERYSTCFSPFECRWS